MAGSILTAAAGQIILVVSGIFLARALGPENRGLLALVFLLVGLVTHLGGLGVPVSLTYWIASGAASSRRLLHALQDFRKLQLLVVLAVHVGLILVVLEPRSPRGFLWVAFLSLTATAAGLSQMYGLAILQGVGRFGLFNSLRLLNGVLYVAGMGSLWLLDRITLVSATLLVIGASIIAAGATWLAVRRLLPLQEESESPPVRPIISFGLRSLFGSSSPLETFRLDQLLVGLVLPPVALGYYVVALALTNLTRFLGQSIGMVTYPKVAAADDTGSQLRIIRRDFALGAVICSSVTLFLLLVAPLLIPFFFGSEFDPAVTTTRVLLVATLFASLRRILVDGIRGSGQPVWGAAAELSTLIAIPLVVIVTRHSDSLVAVALVLMGVNFVGLLAITPVLYLRRRPHLAGCLMRSTLREGDA